jgi:hypothetical protein
MADPFVAVQVGAVSFVDEGIPKVLDTLAERVSGVEGECKIYTGIDIDIPVATPSTRDGLAQCSPERVRAAMLAAFAGGADGVVLSRKYSEMRLDNLAGAGAAFSVDA